MVAKGLLSPSIHAVMRRAERNERIGGLDADTVRGVLDQHPIQFALLFGSYARGTTFSGSDIDIAVAFDGTLTDDTSQRASARFSLIADLMSALGTDDVDVAVIEDLQPRVGKSAFEHGIILIGSREQAERYHREFEERAETPICPRGERFEAILRELEGIK